MVQYTKIKVPKFCVSEGFNTTQQYSKLLSKIHSDNTRCEIQLRKILWSLGYRYRINDTTLLGKPDILFRKLKLIIFIDGDFWHGFDWETRKTKLKSNLGYWIPKIERNIQRDIEQTAILEEQGFKVLRFWEHEVKYHLKLCLNAIINEINNRSLESK